MEVKVKRFLAVFLLVALAVAFVGFSPALADEQVDVYDENNQLVKSVVFKIGVPEYVVNGQTPGVQMDVAPFISDDRTFVPVRFLGNALGVSDENIAWDGPTQTATLMGNTTLQMTIGQKKVVSDGQVKSIDVAPMLVNPGRTMLPARYVAEGLGYQVEWDSATQTVVCWPAGEPKPDVSAAVDYLNKQAEPVQSGETVNGYVIPANTDLFIFNQARSANDGKLMFFQIRLNKGNLQQQYADAESILSQRLDTDTVAKAIEYAKKVQYALENISRENPIYCPNTTFNSPNGMVVDVGAGGGDSIQFDIWSTK